jgi:hypothetical protein
MLSGAKHLNMIKQSTLDDRLNRRFTLIGKCPESARARNVIEGAKGGWSAQEEVMLGQSEASRTLKNVTYKRNRYPNANSR